MAFALGRALHNAGVNVVEVYGRNAEKAAELAKVLEAKAVGSTGELSHGVDAYMLLVSDDAISGLSNELAATVPQIHTSGVSDIEVLSGELKGVVWPIKSINPKSMEDGFAGVPMGIEGSTEEFTSTLLELAKRVGGEAVEAKSKQRSLIHLAAVFTDNFANHCLALSQEILKDSGLDSGLMKELARCMAEGAIEGDSFDRQTGVALRGDLGSQTKHIDLLESQDLKEFYKYLSSHIAKHHEL